MKESNVSGPWVVTAKCAQHCIWNNPSSAPTMRQATIGEMRKRVARRRWAGRRSQPGASKQTLKVIAHQVLHTADGNEHGLHSTTALHPQKQLHTLLRFIYRSPPMFSPLPSHARQCRREISPACTADLISKWTPPQTH